MVSLAASCLSVVVDGRPILTDISLDPQPGTVTAVIGPNGAGKSTLLRVLVGLISPTIGSVVIDGRGVAQLSGQERARMMAYLPQSIPVSSPIAVRDAVALGRFAHGAVPRHLSEMDRNAVDAAMLACDVMGLAKRRVTSLSGGELARMHMARTLATAAPVILADEPVAALDPVHRIAIMNLLRRHADDGGTVVCVLHDLNLAGQYADQILALRDGAVQAAGPVGALLTPQLLASLFDACFSVSDEGGARSVRLIAPLNVPAAAAAS